MEPIRFDTMPSQPSLQGRSLTVGLIMMIEDNTRRGIAYEPNKYGLALFDWFPAQIPTIKLKQIERAMDGGFFAVVTTDQVKHSQAVAGKNREFAHRNCDKGKARREIVSGASKQPHTGTVPPRQNAEAVMLDFV